MERKKNEKTFNRVAIKMRRRVTRLQIRHKYLARMESQLATGDQAVDTGGDQLATGIQAVDSNGYDLKVNSPANTLPENVSQRRGRKADILAAIEADKYTDEEIYSRGRNCRSRSEWEQKKKLINHIINREDFVDDMEYDDINGNAEKTMQTRSPHPTHKSVKVQTTSTAKYLLDLSYPLAKYEIKDDMVMILSWPKYSLMRAAYASYGCLLPPTSLTPIDQY